MESYIIFINNKEDYSFNDIGTELFKIGSVLSYAYKSKKILALINDDYCNIIDIFLKIPYKKILVSEYNNYNFKTISNLDFYEHNNVCINKIDYVHKNISPEVRNLFTTAIINNSSHHYNTYRINDIMNHFTDYDINNYVCITINKQSFIRNYYEKAYYSHFNGKKLVVFSNDLNWAIQNLNFIDSKLIYFIYTHNYDRFSNFALLVFFNNHIIEKNNTSWWGAFLGNYGKKVVVPNNSYEYYLDTWIKQS